MREYVRLICGVIGFMVLYAGVVGCGGGNRMLQIREQYPADMYLLRTGTGDTPEAAIDAARLEIAKYFQTRISGESVIRQYATSTSVGRHTTERRMTELENVITTSADREIPGIIIVGPPEKIGGSLYQAAVALDKFQYARMLRDRIDGYDAAIDRNLAEARMADDPMDKVIHLTRTIEPLAERAEVRRDLDLLTPGMGGAPRDAEMAEIITEINALIDDMLVGVVFESGAEDELKSSLNAAIVDAGFRTKQFGSVEAAASAGADMIITIALDLTSNTHKQTINNKDYTFSRIDWVLTANMVDPATLKVVDSLVLDDKLSDLGSQEQAYGKMVKKIITAQSGEITSWLYSALFAYTE